MKFIFRALIFLLINLPVNFIFSQGLELSFSEHHPFENDYKPISCFNYNSSHILFQQKQKSKYCVLKVNIFNKSLKSANYFNAEFTKESFVGIRNIFDNIILFTSINDGTNTILRSRYLDINSTFSPPKDVYSKPNKSGYSSNFKIANKVFEEHINVLVELPFQSNKNEDLMILKLNSSMKVVNEIYNKLELKFKSKRDNRILISNNGQSYLLKQYWNKGNKFYIYKLGKEIIKEKEIKLTQRKIAALDYFFNSKNELVLSGFYSSPVRYNYEGFFLLKYDEDLDLIHKNQYLLSENIVKSFKSSKEIKEKGYGLDKFILKDFTLDETENHFLLAEHLIKTSSKNESFWKSNGFILIKFNKNGNYIWGCPVVKDQKNKNLNFVGIFSLNENKSIQYFFNELSNLELRKGIPAEYGILNYSGTTSINFSESGLPNEKPMSINFPGKELEKYAFTPKQLNPYEKGPSYFVILNEKMDNFMLGIVK